MGIKNVLWISAFAPYEKVPHAGGQIHNFYLKNLNKNEHFNVELLSFCEEKEYDIVKEDLNKFNVTNTIIPWKHNISVDNIIRKAQYLECKYNPWNKYAGVTHDYYWNHIKNFITKLERQPDIIILQWTQMVLYLTLLKKLCPTSKFIAIEEDVMFLSFLRKTEIAQSKLRNVAAKIRYKKIKKIEINNIKEADLVVLNNPKDEQLVNDAGIYNTWHWSPYFNSMLEVPRAEIISRDIVFFGAMNRKENSDSVIWFNKHVFAKLADLNLRFVIVGNKPRDEVLSIASDRVIVTGFVEDIRPYFQSALCMVAPLVMGAGIKIKVLEGLSAGIPVLTNNIGIEGIPAKNGIDFLYCKTPDEYISSILRLIQDNNFAQRLGKNAKIFISENYDYDKDALMFTNKIKSLCSND